MSAAPSAPVPVVANGIAMPALSGHTGSTDDACPKHVLRRLAEYAGVPASELSTLLVTSSTSTPYKAILEYVSLYAGLQVHLGHGDGHATTPLFVSPSDPKEPDDSISDDEGESQSFMRRRLAPDRNAKKHPSVRKASVPRVVLGLGEASFSWPPPPSLGADHLFELRRARALGLPLPEMSDDHDSGQGNKLFISHFRVGQPVAGAFGGAEQVQAVVVATGVGTGDSPQEQGRELLRVFLEGVVEWRFVKSRQLDGADRYPVLRFVADDRCSRWTEEGMRRARPAGSVVLRAGVLEGIIDDVRRFLSPHAVTWYREHGLPHRRTLLFHGPPGTGKTSVARVLATEFHLTCCILTVTDKKFSNQKLNNALASLPSRALLVLEDVDALFHQRKAPDDAPHELTFSGLLNALDGILSADHVVTVLTTNHVERLDAALIRAGRVDRKFQFDLPSEHEVEALFRRFYPSCSDDTLAKKFAAHVAKRCEKEAQSIATLQQLFIMNRDESAETCASSVDSFFDMYFKNSEHSDSSKEA